MKIKTMSLARSFVSILLLSAVYVATGCSTSKQKEKPLESRGWMGGEVKVVTGFPKTMASHPKAAILLTALVTNTPAAVAGLREGDLILALDHQPVKNLRQLRRKIDPLKPGTPLSVTACRDGQTNEYAVTVGRETFRRGGYFSIYLPTVFSLNLWPHGDRPDLSLAVLGYQVNSVKRLELGSIKEQYNLKCNAKDTPYTEDYKIWLVIMECSKGKRIAGQQLAEVAK